MSTSEKEIKTENSELNDSLILHSVNNKNKLFIPSLIVLIPGERSNFYAVSLLGNETKVKNFGKNLFYGTDTFDYHRYLEQQYIFEGNTCCIMVGEQNFESRPTMHQCILIFDNKNIQHYLELITRRFGDQCDFFMAEYRLEVSKIHLEPISEVLLKTNKINFCESDGYVNIIANQIRSEIAENLIRDSINKLSQRSKPSCCLTM